MNLYPKTDSGIVLIGFYSEKNIFYFPSEDYKQPGVSIDWDHKLPIADQIISLMKNKLHISSTIETNNFYYWDQFDTMISNQSGNPISLNLAKYKIDEKKLGLSWKTFPSLLKNMPKNRNRLAYLQAWQVFSGAWLENIRAVESRTGDK